MSRTSSTPQRSGSTWPGSTGPARRFSTGAISSPRPNRSSDDFVRPLAIQRGARLKSGLLVLGIFGGVAVFGFLGLFIGPVILGLSKTIVDLPVERRGTSGDIW
ncbi:AI-2E family transporter [Natronococcus sp. JC468]|nr:AI-2E family transporter [Natronococcus sp. JC468]